MTGEIMEFRTRLQESFDASLPRRNRLYGLTGEFNATLHEPSGDYRAISRWSFRQATRRRDSLIDPAVSMITTTAPMCPPGSNLFAAKS